MVGRKNIELVTEAARRILDGDENGAHEVYAGMSDLERLRFDFWLVSQADPLATEGGPAEQRFVQRATRMAELEAERKGARQPPGRSNL
jgi:hypothetical protein